MKKKKLKVTFENPNTFEDIFEALIKMLAEANKDKAEQAIKSALQNDDKTNSKTHPAA